MTQSRPDMVIDRVDANDHVIGTTVRRTVFAARANFRVAHVFVFNLAREILLQRIASGLRHEFLWGSSVAGYLEAGEDYEAAAHRKLHDELGLSLAQLDVCGKTSMLDAGCTKFITLFKTVYGGPISPNPADADAVEFVSLATIAHERASGARAFTPTFLHVLDFYLQSPTP